MDFFDFLGLLGGLALFLYGMDMLGDGLQRIAGGKLEAILGKLTSGPVRAVLLGMGVTAVIQSSSAATVMVVGLVNSGIMKLEQAIGVIMGANVGTTITSWILSLTGISSENPFIMMLNPANFCPIVAVVGVGLNLFSKSEKYKSIGKFLAGFAILMFGMQDMSSAVAPLQKAPSFQNVFLMLENPLLGMLAGILLAAILQSSSAAMGILQALSATGAVSMASAVSIIMGQNIGTCITAMISSLNTGKHGKRAAFIHLYFNVIGTLIFIVFFFSLNAVFKFSFLNRAASPVSIAIIHSVFNIFAVAVLFPFRSLLKNLAIRTVPDKHPKRKDYDEEFQEYRKKLKELDELFLETPSFAIERAKEVLRMMFTLSRNNVQKALALIGGYDEQDFLHLANVERMIDKYDDTISSYLVKLSGRKLNPAQSSEVYMIFHLLGYFERMGDQAFHAAKNAKELSESKYSFSDEANFELEIYKEAILEITQLSYEMFIDEKNDELHNIMALEEIVDDLSNSMDDRHIKRLMNDQCAVDVGFLWSDMIKELEKISDNCKKIAIIIKNKGQDDELHAKIAKIKENDSKSVRERYDEYKKKYNFDMQKNP